jgi:hypothetical protein
MLELHLQMFDIVRMYGEHAVRIFHVLFFALFLLRCPFLRIFLDELFDPSCRVDDLLPTGKERMTLRTQVDRYLLDGRASLDLVSARAGNDA